MNTEHCRHCAQPIGWTEQFGWIHGELNRGWNTSCETEQGIFRAAPILKGWRIA